ncbi:DnaA ATPase domain-containing protein [Bacillus sp. Marseille-Q3570]|uniref:DnaA ATPase domain-containing protein n=1 Tax=Bacillus sp. Marseille-Q3570 TaxID=2963522 RepID=UPI0021B74646|nr:DnaA/Hda family protein [Bacillus sp. Marseille-Q3570]
MENRLQTIMKTLQEKHFPLQEDRQVESIVEDHECTECKDKGFILYRVHKDTEWKWDEQKQMCVPTSKVLESDYHLGKVCTPDKAWEWHDRFSEKCSCIKQRNIEMLLQSSEITESFRQNNFKNFVIQGKDQMIKDAYQCAKEYILDFMDIQTTRRNSIALLGQPGAGKTHLLTAISNHLMIDKQVSVLYFPYVEGFDDLKNDFEKLEGKMERMKKTYVLFIDDLFKPIGKNRKPRATEWQIEKIYSLVNYKYLNNLPILISSELTIDELEAIDEALGSRIYDMCKDYTVIIRGDKRTLNQRLG